MGPYSGVLWFLVLWLAVAFWVAELLEIRGTSWMWLYMCGHVIAIQFVGKSLEKRLTPTDPETGLPLRVKLTSGRRTVLIAIAVVWTMEWVALLRFYPFLLTGGLVPGGPFTLLCVPLLIVVTILEAIWRRRTDP